MPQNPDDSRRGINLKFDPNLRSARGKSWFFGIGINKYTEFPHLNNAVKDVRDLVTLLQEKYDFDPEYTLTLYDEEATRENIIETLDDLDRKLGPDDKILIYYSGHGYLNKSNDLGYWITTNAKSNSTVQYINNSAVRDYMKAFKSRHTLLISDSCFSGNLLVRGINRSTAALQELKTLPSRWLICSGRKDEEVYDGDPGGNSPFAESIMDALRRNSEREFLVSTLFNRVREQTAANYPQLPVGSPLKYAGHQGGEYIFRRRANEAEDWATAKAIATIPVYRQFLENHPNGVYVDEARGNIAYLEEETAWKEASLKKNIDLNLKYLDDHPKGRYRDQALKAIHDLEEEMAWQQALDRHTVFEYEQYKKKYPDGKYQKEAEAARVSIRHQQKASQQQKENRIWEAAQTADSIKDYKDYLRRYPDGKCAEAAKERLTELETQARYTMAEKKKAKQQKWEENKKRRQAMAWKVAQGTSNQLRKWMSLTLVASNQFIKWVAAGKWLRGWIPLAVRGRLPTWFPMAVAGLVLLLPVVYFISGNWSTKSEKITFSSISLNGQTWMTQNLDIEVPGSWYHSDLKFSEQSEYGRLYTWDAAQNACSKVGEGWRLPTDNDWAKLVEMYGGEQEAYKALMKSGENDFSAIFGGYQDLKDNKPFDLNELGYYWSSTEDEEKKAQGLGYCFIPPSGKENPSGKLARFSYLKSRSLSCRCVKD